MPTSKRSTFASSLALAALVLALHATLVGAQILKVPRSGQSGGGGIPFYLSTSIGFSVSDVVNDGKTDSRWDFGSGAQYRASLEVGMGAQSGIGLTFTHARMPMVYSSGQTPAPNGCARCDAHANIQTAAASFHAGGGAGFHQEIELSVGALRFSKFTIDQNDAELPPNADTDFFFSVGYGFGYGFSNNFDLFVIQDYANSIHQRSGLAGNARANAQHYTTRLGVRLGFGDTTR
jgi:hypothetical protein